MHDRIPISIMSVHPDRLPASPEPKLSVLDVIKHRPILSLVLAGILTVGGVMAATEALNINPGIESIDNDGQGFTECDQTQVALAAYTGRDSCEGADSGNPGSR